MTPRTASNLVNDRDRFKRACLGEDIEHKKHWIVTGICRGCGRPVTQDDFAIWHTYWEAMWAPAHKECVGPGMKQEAIDCQMIDTDCNDCRHFIRGAHDRQVTEPSFVPGRLHVLANGRCAKFDKPVLASPNFCTGHQCFEHRRSA